MAYGLFMPGDFIRKSLKLSPEIRESLHTLTVNVFSEFVKMFSYFTCYSKQFSHVIHRRLLSKEMGICSPG